MTMTVTEALAEIATIDKRLPKKGQAMTAYVARIEAMRDPLEKSGGSEKFLAEEKQSFADLQTRKINLRRAIAAVNAETMIMLGSREMSVADWLVWKRECYVPYRDMLKGMLGSVNSARAHAQQHNVTMVRSSAEAPSDQDIIVNLDEQALLAELDELEETYGRLDGLLSLKNATTTV